MYLSMVASVVCLAYVNEPSFLISQSQSSHNSVSLNSKQGIVTLKIRNPMLKSEIVSHPPLFFVQDLDRYKQYDNDEKQALVYRMM